MIFRMDWVRIEYACRERNGSLRFVPPGVTRKELFCEGCEAAVCLFKSSREPEPDNGKDKVRVQAGRSKGARDRARGVNSAGQALQASCWNCIHLRTLLDLSYVCRWDPRGKPFSRWTAERTRLVGKIGCELFELRRVMEIPFLDEDKVAA